MSYTTVRNGITYNYEEELNDIYVNSTSVGKFFAGNLANNFDVDWYAISLPAYSQITVKFSADNGNLGRWSTQYFDSQLSLVGSSNFSIATIGGIDSATTTFSTRVAGTYYFKVQAYDTISFKGSSYFIDLDYVAPSIISAKSSEVSIIEGDIENPIVSATLNFDLPAKQTTIIHYTLRSGTAFVGSDIVGTTVGNLIVEAGSSSVTLPNTFILSDKVQEGDEYFWVDFDSISMGNALFSGGANTLSVKVNIINDDSPVILSNVDLTPYQPAGWSDKIVVSTSTGGHTDSSTIYSDQSLYIDTATWNTGTGDANSIFYQYLYVDGVFRTSWWFSGLTTGNYAYFDDYALGSLSVGTHTLKFVTDANSVLAETNESNNEYTKTITVAARVATPIIGTTGADSIASGPGNDTIDGAGGTDTAIYTGARKDYILSFPKLDTPWSLSDTVTNRDGLDSLINVERLKFLDESVALDVGATQSAGGAALLIGAILGRNLMLEKKEVLGAVIGLNEQGFSHKTLAGALMRLDIWGLLANNGAPTATSTQIANYLLTRVNGAAPDAQTLSTAAAALDLENGNFGLQGTFLYDLSLSQMNQSKIDLVGIATTGLAFIPLGG